MIGAGRSARALRRHLDRPSRCSDHGGAGSDAPESGQRGRIGVPAAAGTLAYQAPGRLCTSEVGPQTATSQSADRPALAIAFVWPPVPMRTSPMPRSGSSGRPRPRARVRHHPSPHWRRVSGRRRQAARCGDARGGEARQAWCPPYALTQVGTRKATATRALREKFRILTNGI
jgi:hypothetical protein